MEAMAFHWDTNVGLFLFPGLNINGLPSLIILCLVLVIVTIIFESIKVLQTKARARAAREMVRLESCPASERVNLLNKEHANRLNSPFMRKFIKLFGQSLIFLFQKTLGYILMLVVMVYNGYVFIFVILGLGLGYFIFGNMSMRINVENMQARTTNVICSSKCPTEPSTSQLVSSSRPGGYVNEMIASSSSTSSTNSDNYNNSNYTQTSTLEKEIEVHHTNDNDDNLIIQSCRL